MLNIKRNVLSAALASAIIASSGQAYAQAAAEAPKAMTAEEVAAAEAKAKAEAEAAAAATTLDVVEVRGIRRGVENAIETKRESRQIIEAVSAEDIGKLPDASIADSIARLPGLTAQRDRGRASEINIRGLAGDFATTTLNGRELAVADAPGRPYGIASAAGRVYVTDVSAGRLFQFALGQ